MRQVRDPERADAEIKVVRQLVEEEAQAVRMSAWEALSTKWIRRVIIIGIGVAMIQQLTGINSIMYYGTLLLEQSGWGSETAIIANTTNGLVAVTACIISMSIMNRVNRRTMLLFGFVGTTTAHLLIGLSALLIRDGNRPSRCSS